MNTMYLSINLTVSFLSAAPPSLQHGGVARLFLNRCLSIFGAVADFIFSKCFFSLFVAFIASFIFLHSTHLCIL